MRLVHKAVLFFGLTVFVLGMLAGMLLTPLTAGAQTLPQPAPAAHKYRADLVRAAHSLWGLDAPVSVLAAQVHQESGWNPVAVSRAGAQGMAQFMPATASWWCDLNELSPAECQPRNAVWALRSMVGYDKWLFDRTPSYYPPDERLWVALRAYNGGLGNWQAEARVAQQSLLPSPKLPDAALVDRFCGRAKRHVSHCPENVGYPYRIMVVLSPRYTTWEPGS